MLVHSHSRLVEKERLFHVKNGFRPRLPSLSSAFFSMRLMPLHRSCFARSAVVSSPFTAYRTYFCFIVLVRLSMKLCSPRMRLLFVEHRFTQDKTFIERTSKNLTMGEHVPKCSTWDTGRQQQWKSLWFGWICSCTHKQAAMDRLPHTRHTCVQMIINNLWKGLCAQWCLQWHNQQAYGPVPTDHNQTGVIVSSQIERWTPNDDNNNNNNNNNNNKQQQNGYNRTLFNTFKRTIERPKVQQKQNNTK